MVNTSYPYSTHPRFKTKASHFHNSKSGHWTKFTCSLDYESVLSTTVVDKVIAELESCGFQCLIAEIGGNGAEICFNGSS